MNKKEKIKQLLEMLENSLRSANLWSSEEIGEDKLLSKMPFCADTMSYPEWLQFVFIRKMQTLIEGEDSLPAASGLFQMAEVYFGREIFKYKELAGVLLNLDKALRDQMRH